MHHRASVPVEPPARKPATTPVGGVTTQTITTCSGVGTVLEQLPDHLDLRAGRDHGERLSRSIVTLNDQSAIINVTTSGITVLPWNYSAFVSLP